jgi:hypothetical protein
MSEPLDDNPDDDSFQTQIDAFREEVALRAEVLREYGLEVDAFLEDCDRMTAFLDGHGEPGFDAETFIARLRAFTDEFNQTVHLQKQAKLIETVAAVPGVVEMLGQAAERMRAHGGPMELRTAADLEAQAAEARQRMERGEMPLDEIQNASLTLAAQLGELNRRNLFRSAALALYWEKQSPEWWARLSPKQRASLEDAVEQWRAQREEVLSQLPLEDRRRLEAMTLEDFDRPGACDP